MDRKSAKKPNVSRRGFVQLASATAASAGAVATGLHSEPVAAPETASDQVSAGYHESEHVKTYYTRARV